MDGARCSKFEIFRTLRNFRRCERAEHAGGAGRRMWMARDGFRAELELLKRSERFCKNKFWINWHFIVVWGMLRVEGRDEVSIEFIFRSLLSIQQIITIAAISSQFHQSPNILAPSLCSSVHSTRLPPFIAVYRLSIFENDFRSIRYFVHTSAQVVLFSRKLRWWKIDHFTADWMIWSLVTSLKSELAGKVQRAAPVVAYFHLKISSINRIPRVFIKCFFPLRDFRTIFVIVGIGGFVASKNSIDKKRYDNMKVRERMRKANEGQYQLPERFNETEQQQWSLHNRIFNSHT